MQVRPRNLWVEDRTNPPRPLPQAAYSFHIYYLYIDLKYLYTYTMLVLVCFYRSVINEVYLHEFEKLSSQNIEYLILNT